MAAQAEHPTTRRRVQTRFGVHEEQRIPLRVRGTVHQALLPEPDPPMVSTLDVSSPHQGAANITDCVALGAPARVFTDSSWTKASCCMILGTWRRATERDSTRPRTVEEESCTSRCIQGLRGPQLERSGFHSSIEQLDVGVLGLRRSGGAARPISVLRFWISEGLTQA